MKEKIMGKIADNFGLIMVGFILLIAFACIGLRIYVFAKYGNTPIKDVPAWAYWVMDDKGRGSNK